MELNKYRVLKASVGWSDGLFIIDERITYKQIKNNPSTSFLCEKDFLGLYSFDDKFLQHLQSKNIGDYKIFYENLWERDRVNKHSTKTIEIENNGDYEDLF
jgi:hypothetical protein